MKIGEIDITNSILNLEHDVLLMQKMLNYILANNFNIKFASKIEIEKFEKEIIFILQSKYPSMGIQSK